MTNCTTCGSPVGAEDAFCQECGQRLGDACAYCGSSLGANDEFCTECGRPRDGSGKFSVVLVAVGPRVVDVVRAIRDMTGLELKDAKRLMDYVPSTVTSNQAWSAATKLGSQLEGAGASVQLRPDG